VYRTHGESSFFFLALTETGQIIGIFVGDAVVAMSNVASESHVTFVSFLFASRE